MRISDWSSDVCSSDLIGSADLDSAATTVGAGATNSIAIGRNVKVSDNSTSSVGLGSNVSVNASNAVGIGVSASAGGAYGVAMGRYANAGAEAATAVGNVAQALGGSSTAMGSNSTRSEEHTSELQSLMRNSYAVFCLKKT